MVSVLEVRGGLVSVPDVLLRCTRCIQLTNSVGCLVTILNTLHLSDDNIVPDVAPCSIQKRNRVGAITFIVLVADKDICSHDKGERVLIKQNQRFIGIEAPHSMNSTHTKHARPIISVGSDTYLYQDSIAIIPSKISDVDAISTATAALLGVHCSLPSRKLKFEESGEEKNGNVVIVGGGEYALYLLRALSGLDVKATLVSARPTWSLPSVDELATSKRNKELIEILPPSVGSLSLGFALAIGEFDTLIDTLGDQMGLGRTRTVLDEEQSARFQNQLEELHGCDKYVSTITRSQQYVLKKGLLFARDPVIRYQKEVEKATTKYQSLPPPLDFARTTLQPLLDQNIVYPSNENENGSNGMKSSFVRGWSLSDLTELKTWPREGAGRFGFPMMDLRVPSVSSAPKRSNRKPTRPARSEDKEDLEHSTGKGTEANTDKASTPTNKASSMIQTNPHVISIRSLSELNEKVIEPNRLCILFLTASYCQKCKQLSPKFNRVARLSTKSNSNVMFAHCDISGVRGKQIGSFLDVAKVPSVVVFKSDGDRTSSIVLDRTNIKNIENVVEALATASTSALETVLL